MIDRVRRRGLVLLLAAGCIAGACQTQRAVETSASAQRPEHAAPAAGTQTQASATPATGASFEQMAPGSYAVIDGEAAPVPAYRMGDRGMIRRIVDEGKNRSQVMNHLTHLCEDIGPRLTGSTNIARSSDWIVDQYRKWGVSNPRTEQWGTIASRFDRGPSTGKVFLPRPRRPAGADGAETPSDVESSRDLQFSTLAWTLGTHGPRRGPVIWEPTTLEEYEEVKGKLDGAWVLLRAQPAGGVRGVRNRMSTRHQARMDVRKEHAEGKEWDAFEEVRDRVLAHNVHGWISTSRDDRVWTGAFDGWRDVTPQTASRDIEVVITGPDYDYINSRVADGENVEVEFDLRHTLTAGPIACSNVIAEIPGTVWPDEVVIVSAHLDSWNGPGSQGCTDNGTGTAVTMEAARLLVAAGAKPKRTIRFIHWTGEEQGLLGSKAYVEQNQDSLSKVVAVFVDDGGTNSQGGLQCIESMAPMLAAATAPVNGHFLDGATGKPLTVNVQINERMPRGGGSDHASFNRVGVPGFFWDEVGRAEYRYGWHTQFDTLTLAIPEYLMQSATCSAITAYNLACAEEMLPRAPVPQEGEQSRPPVAAR